jgi:hypothetical protein
MIGWVGEFPDMGSSSAAFSSRVFWEASSSIGFGLGSPLGGRAFVRFAAEPAEAFPIKVMGGPALRPAQGGLRQNAYRHEDQWCEGVCFEQAQATGPEQGSKV